MARFFLTLQYDGTNSYGWQRQNNAHTTIQAAIEKAIADLVGAPVSVVGASRTDAGVHARRTAAHVDIETRLRGEELRRAIDVRLPSDVSLIALEEVAADFHCRHRALGKCYAYRVHNARHRSPLAERNAWFCPRELDVAAMRDAAKPLVGEHDFSAFATLLSDYPNKLTSQPDPERPDKPEGNVRTLHAIEILQRGHLLTFLVFGDGFLRGMVRGVVGTLIDAGLGKLTQTDVEKILVSRDRREAGANLPANGLTLEAVFYDRAEMERWLARASEAAKDERMSLPGSVSSPLELLG
ncbi:MAG: tRNA pseudouridine(38-40) synthase TruA [Planctomycetaceae bacterium]|nr:tRNA pseudouridine(38-40) synthase TruA [Planctomycetaceae bacterium]